MQTLQLGLGWFTEGASGLARVYRNLMHVLPEVGVGVRGLVAGTADVALRTEGRVQAFAAPEASLPVRWRRARQHALRLIAEDRSALVASHFALYTAPFVRDLGDVPLVVHFHGPWAYESRVEGGGRLATFLKARIERSVYRRAARCIVLSEAFAGVLHRSYGVPEARIRIVPGGVDVERFATDRSRAEARRRLSWPADRPILFTVRRLQRRMGLENLIDAMAAVRRAVPEVLLLIAGKGMLFNELADQIAARGLRENVRLLGFVPDDDLPLAYRAADLSVVPTVALEGFGLVTLESLAAGTPVLVTPVGGLPEAVRGLSDALVLPGTATEDLAEGISAALKGSISLPEADACRRYAREQFAWPVIARQVRAVYEEVIG